MENKEKFEDIFRERFSQGMDLPVDQPNWEQIKDMLNAAREKKKRRRIFIIFFFGLLSGICVMIPLITNKKEQNVSADVKTERLVVKENKNEALAENKNIDQKELIASVTEEKKKIEKENDEKIISENLKNDVQTKSSNNNQTKESETAKQITDALVLVPKKTKHVMQETKKEKSAIVSSSPEKIIAVNPPVAKQPEKINITPVITPIVVPQSTVTNTKISNEEIKNSPNANAENVIAGGNSKTDSAKTLIVIPAEIINADSTKKKTDSAAVVKNETLQQSDKSTTPGKNIFSIEAGAGFSMGWHYNDIKEGRGFNPLFGFGYTRNLNTRWSIHTGLQATSIGYLTASEHTIKHINSDFGYNSKDTIVSTTRLYYITVPIQFQYNLNKKNQIGAGGTFSYLINGSGKLTTYSQTDDAGITNKKTISQTGYVKGFNAMNVSLMLMYTRRFSDKFSVSLVPYYGLTDVKDNSFFSRQKFERDMGIKLILSYNIFK